MSPHAHDAPSDDPAVAADISRSIIELVRENVPGAQHVWVVEDDGHEDTPDDKHGHLYAITGVDPDSAPLVLGSTDEYQDADWSWDADDLVYALHRRGPSLFTRSWPGDRRRFAVLEVS